MSQIQVVSKNHP